MPLPARWAASIVAVLLALDAPAALAQSAPPESGDDVVVGWTVREDKGSSFNADIEIRNATDITLSDWQIVLPFPHEVRDVSGAVSVQDGNTLTLVGRSPIEPAHSRRVSLTAASTGPISRVPDTCKVTGLRCRVVLAAPPGQSPDSQQPPSAPLAAPPAASRLDLTYQVVTDWGSGQAVTVTVRNGGDRAITDWQVQLDAGVHVTSMWNASSTSGDGTVRAASEDWSGRLDPGEAAQFGFTAEPGASPAPDGCVAEVEGLIAKCSLRVADPEPALPPWTDWSW